MLSKKQRAESELAAGKMHVNTETSCHKGWSDMGGKNMHVKAQLARCYSKGCPFFMDPGEANFAWHL